MRIENRKDFWSIISIKITTRIIFNLSSWYEWTSRGCFQMHSVISDWWQAILVSYVDILNFCVIAHYIRILKFTLPYKLR